MYTNLKKQVLLQKWFVVAAVCGWLLSSVAATVFAGPNTGGTVIWGRSGGVNTLDPAKGVSAESLTVIATIYETLVRYGDDFATLEPSLALTWESTNNAKDWIFRLRKGVRFHDGRPFNAQAVVFSFMRQMDPRHPYFPKDIGYATYIFDQVQTVQALGDHTVKISLKKPYAPFLAGLSIPAAGIVSPAAVKKWGAQFEDHPVGTGPFKFKQKGDDGEVIVERNPAYWQAAPHLDRVIYKPITDNRKRLLALSTGAVDVMDGITPAAIRRIQRNKDLQLVRIPGLNIGYLAMNTAKRPFDSVMVRRAVNHAINKKNLIKFLYQGLAIPAVNPFPPVIWGFNEQIADYPYDPQEAVKLLRQAGYPDGFTTTLWQMPVARFYNPEPARIAQIVKANLEAVGIRVQLISSWDWKTYLKKGKAGEHEMAFFGWGAEYADPDYFLYNLLDQDNAVKGHASNRAFFKHTGLHKLLIAAQQTANQAERIRLYRQAQHIIKQQAPIVPLAHMEQFLVFHRKVRNITIDPREYHLFHKAWIEQ